MLDAGLRYHLCPPSKPALVDARRSSLMVFHLQDKIDDVKVGIRSTALLFGQRTRPILSALSASTVSFITYAGVLNAQGAPFYFGVCLGAAQLARVLWSTDFDSRASCWRGFVGCGWSGLWVFTGAFVDHASVAAGVVW
jgi:4-hydroxybenzoate polyprenyltransferase